MMFELPVSEIRLFKNNNKWLAAIRGDFFFVLSVVANASFFYIAADRPRLPFVDIRAIRLLFIPPMDTTHGGISFDDLPITLPRRSSSRQRALITDTSYARSGLVVVANLINLAIWDRNCDISPFVASCGRCISLPGVRLIRCKPPTYPFSSSVIDRSLSTTALATPHPTNVVELCSSLPTDIYLWVVWRNIIWVSISPTKHSPTWTRTIP